jgi:pimeloyl-ACP methyl ester carboxylesterase
MGHTPAARPVGIQHSFADVNGVRLHYASAGGAAARAAAGATAGASKLILFLHGFPEFWYAWKEQLVEFGRDHLAVAPDMRGYNLSSKPAEVGRYEIKQLVGDVRALVEHLQPGHAGAKKCFLVGHDWGGVVAWAASIACPEVVEKLVIINSPHPGIFQRELAQNPAQQQASQYMLLLRSPAAESMISANNFELWQKAILGEGLRLGYFTEADRQAYVEAWSQPGALTGGLNYYRAAKIDPHDAQAGPPIAQEGSPSATSSAPSAESATPTARAGAPTAKAGPPAGPDQPLTAAGDGGARMESNFPSLEVKAPTLVIWGEQDPYLLTGNLNGLDRYVPNLRIERIPDGTHWVVHEKPALVNSLIRSFLDS